MEEIIIRRALGEDLTRVKAFLGELFLGYDEDIEYTLVAVEKEEIRGTCSYSGSVIKCFGVDKAYKGEGLAPRLITQLMDDMFDRGIRESFVFTKAINSEIFKGLGFSELINTGEVTLLEGGLGNIGGYVKNMFLKSGLSNNPKAALVMNCNPFTLGHKYLIEKASTENAEVVVFVVEEERSVFPFKDRLELIIKGTEEYKNVRVIPGGRYIISQATFPNYFLKLEDERLKAYTQIDTGIFGKYISPQFNIGVRYVGEEPLDRATSAYNEALFNSLPKYGVRVKCIERLCTTEGIISASVVRGLFGEGRFSELVDYVPKTTLDYLKSDKGKEIADKIMKGMA